MQAISESSCSGDTNNNIMLVLFLLSTGSQLLHVIVRDTYLRQMVFRHIVNDDRQSHKTWVSERMQYNQKQRKVLAKEREQTRKEKMEREQTRKKKMEREQTRKEKMEREQTK